MYFLSDILYTLVAVQGMNVSCVTDIVHTCSCCVTNIVHTCSCTRTEQVYHVSHILHTWLYQGVLCCAVDL